MAKDEPDVKVHHRDGCPICGDTSSHTHAQDEWRSMLDRMDAR